MLKYGRNTKKKKKKKKEMTLSVFMSHERHKHFWGILIFIMGVSPSDSVVVSFC